MEPANIDWKTIESVFVQDELYEHINAPKWIDFETPNDEVDDEAWFCKPECRHPKTAEDFIRPTLSATKSLPLRDRNLRDGRSTNRRFNKSKTFREDENENPNLLTPPEKRKPEEMKQAPKLKSTLSASNLFAGREILSQITEFCSELKRMVMKSKEGEQKEKLLEVEKGENSRQGYNKGLVEVEVEVEMKMDEGKGDVVEKSVEKKERKLKMNEKENNPITLDLKNLTGQSKQEQRLLQVRTNPPSPQCFSAYREPLRRAKPTTPLKASKAIRAGKGVLLEQSNRLEKDEQSANPQSTSVAGKEARSLEMLWLLKPCLAK